MSYIDLKAERVDSPHRAAPLGGRVQYRGIGSKPGKGWRTVGAHWRIAKCCFNDLGEAWTRHCEWRIASDEPRGVTA